MSIPEQQMQQIMEAGEHEMNALLDEYSPPHDWSSPEWGSQDKVHNWRNYANNGLKEEWFNLTGKQRIIISSLLDDIAGAEHWD